MVLDELTVISRTLSLLEAQGAASVTREGWCRYRAGGNACAIGVHIPAEDYSPAMEDFSMSPDLLDRPVPGDGGKAALLASLRRNGLLNEDEGEWARLKFLGQLQDCHDQASKENRSRFVGELRLRCGLLALRELGLETRTQADHQ